MSENKNTYPTSDDMIRDRVLDRLRSESSIDSSKIEVTVQNGVVSLHGKADTVVERNLAQELAAKVEAVVNVENHLHIEAGLAHALSNLAAHIQGDIIKDKQDN